MKNISTFLSVLALILVGILYFLHFKSDKTNPVTVDARGHDSVSNSTSFKIAYFEMDSLESNFELVKEVKSELNKKENAINNELSRLEKNYRDKITNYQNQGANMTQVQSEAAQRDVMQMQQNMQSRKQALDQEYQDFYMRRMKSVKDKIEEFLKEYNRTKGYSYIVAYEPGLFYYRDTVYNITPDVIKGLNEMHKKKKN
jgi:Outer membrane protein